LASATGQAKWRPTTTEWSRAYFPPKASPIACSRRSVKSSARAPKRFERVGARWRRPPAVHCRHRRHSQDAHPQKAPSLLRRRPPRPWMRARQLSGTRSTRCSAAANCQVPDRRPTSAITGMTDARDPRALVRHAAEAGDWRLVELVARVLAGRSVGSLGAARRAYRTLAVRLGLRESGH